MAYLAVNRNKLTVPAAGAVDIKVDLIEGSTKFQCITCDETMEDNKDRSLFECSECGYEMTYPESIVLAQRYVDVIRDRFGLKDKAKKKGILWRLATWFVNRKRLPVPKS